MRRTALAAGVAAAVLLGFAERPALAFRVAQVSGETCAAYSFDEEFEFGCVTGVGITSSTDSGTFQPGDPVHPGHPLSAVSSTWGNAGAFQHLSGLTSVATQARREGDVGVLDDLATGATASLAITISPTSLSPEVITLDFDLVDAMLSLFVENFQALDEDLPLAEVAATISCTGCEGGGVQWSYQAFFATVHDGVQIGFQDTLDFFDPQGIGKPTWNVENSTPGSASASIDAPFQGQLTLGTLQPDGSMELRYRVRARTFVGVYNDFGQPVPPPPNEPRVDALAWVEDPFGLEGSPAPPAFSDHVFLNDIPLSTLVRSRHPPGSRSERSPRS